MTKAIINNKLVTVKVLKTRKLFWLFEQVLIESEEEYFSYSVIDSILYEFNLVGRVKLNSVKIKKWIPKSDLIEE